MRCNENYPQRTHYLQFTKQNLDKECVTATVRYIIKMNDPPLHLGLQLPHVSRICFDDFGNFSLINIFHTSREKL